MNRMSWLNRFLSPLLQPTQRSVRGFALSAVIANCVIIATGEAVRLSSSGLGCSDWPTCTSTSLIATTHGDQTLLNSWIEFGNRLLNFPLVAIAGLTFIACVRYKPGGNRRKDLVWLSAILPLGVIAQAIVGGILVLTKLPPALVSVHFLLSSVIIVSAAVILHVRVDEGAGPVRNLVRVDLRMLAALLAGATVVMLAAGTVVTGTGPLAGTTIDSHGHLHTVPRYHFNLEEVTQLHADIGWFIGAIAVALFIGLWFSPGVPRAARRNGLIVMAGLGVQGIIGYVQYFNHLPAGLVWVHASSSVVVWVFVLRLYLSTRERVPAGDAGDSAAATDAAEAATAADAAPAR